MWVLGAFLKQLVFGEKGSYGTDVFIDNYNLNFEVKIKFLHMVKTSENYICFYLQEIHFLKS